MRADPKIFAVFGATDGPVTVLAALSEARALATATQVSEGPFFQDPERE